MSWADQHIQGLQSGQTVQFRPRGHSMRGRVNDRQLVTVAPIDEPPEVNDIVLCRARGNVYLHLVKGIRGHGDARRYLIGNNRGGLNGWIGISAIYGICTQVED